MDPKIRKILLVIGIIVVVVLITAGIVALVNPPKDYQEWLDNEAVDEEGNWYQSLRSGDGFQNAVINWVGSKIGYKVGENNKTWDAAFKPDEGTYAERFGNYFDSSISDDIEINENVDNVVRKFTVGDIRQFIWDENKDTRTFDRANFYSNMEQLS